MCSVAIRHDVGDPRYQRSQNPGLPLAPAVIRPTSHSQNCHIQTLPLHQRHKIAVSKPSFTYDIKRTQSSCLHHFITSQGPTHSPTPPPYNPHIRNDKPRTLLLPLPHNLRSRHPTFFLPDIPIPYRELVYHRHPILLLQTRLEMRDEGPCYLWAAHKHMRIVLNQRYMLMVKVAFQ